MLSEGHTAGSETGTQMAQHQSLIFEALTLVLVKVEDVKVCLSVSAKWYSLFLKQSAKGTSSHHGDRLALSSGRLIQEPGVLTGHLHTD